MSRRNIVICNKCGEVGHKAAKCAPAPVISGKVEAPVATKQQQPQQQQRQQTQQQQSSGQVSAGAGAGGAVAGAGGAGAAGAGGAGADVSKTATATTTPGAGAGAGEGEATPTIDIGLNLGSKQFSRDRPAVMARAAAAGVGGAILTSGTLREAGDLARIIGSGLGQSSGVVLTQTAGVHPHNAKTWVAGGESKTKLLQMVAAPEVVAVGECGLDYDRNFSTPVAQRAAFAEQIEVANAVKKPLFLHVRGPEGCYQDFAAALTKKAPEVGACVHCFTGTAQQAKAILAAVPDAYFGITGWICDERRGGPELAKVVRDIIPRDRLLIETDAPFLTPRGVPALKGIRRCEPGFLPYVTQAVASALGMSVAEVAVLTTTNARRLFGGRVV